MIGPGGVFVVDSKQYRGRLQLDGSGRPWHGRYPLAPAVRAVSWEADQAAQGAQVPWGKVATEGVPVVAARRLPSMLRALPAVLGPERVADWITSPGPLPRRRLTPAACRVALTLLLPQRATF
jgi:hypothetical protein